MTNDLMTQMNWATWIAGVCAILSAIAAGFEIHDQDRKAAARKSAKEAATAAHNAEIEPNAAIDFARDYSFACCAAA